MARLLLISLGQLTGHILEAVARSGTFREIVVAGRNPAHGIAKTNLARIGGAIEGRFPSIEFRKLDVNDLGAGARIHAISPDVALAAPSMLPWWKLDRLRGLKAEAARSMPFAGWLACHLAPMLAVQRAWADSGAPPCGRLGGYRQHRYALAPHGGSRCGTDGAHRGRCS